MKKIYVYPGSFCPPTYGHLHIVKQAAKIFNKVIILCSENTDKEKNRWFTPTECKELWLAYKLPKNVEILTLCEFMKTRDKKSEIIMIRGIRDDKDMEYEKKVMELNRTQFDINHYFFVCAPKSKCNISSSRARKMAENLELEKLHHLVSPLIITALLKKVLNTKNIFMVVAKPGSGKSTFLKTLSELDSKNIFINTDSFNHQLRSFVNKKTKGRDLIEMAIKDDKELKRIIKTPWFNLLRESLISTPKDCNVFIEIPYGMQKDKRMYRFIGGQIIYVDCDDNKLIARVINRGTPELIPFIQKIPGLTETKKICQMENLRLTIVNANSTLADLESEARGFNKKLQGR